MTPEYERALGARLRSTRMQRGLSRHDVQVQSDGCCSAVAVGSYERAERAVTVTRLAELAEFYGVPVDQLLPDRPFPGPDPARGWCSTCTGSPSCPANGPVLWPGTRRPFNTSVVIATASC